MPLSDRGFETAERYPVARDVLHFDLYAGMCLIEVTTHAWTEVDMTATAVCIDDTESGEPTGVPDYVRRPKD